MQAHSLCIAIADKLRARILSHQMPPGSDINDGALALEYGVSRTPVREAMKLLCSVLAHQLRTLQQASPPVSTELTQRLYAMAQARLQLALGPEPHTHTPTPSPHAVAEPVAEPLHAALAH